MTNNVDTTLMGADWKDVTPKPIEHPKRLQMEAGGDLYILIEEKRGPKACWRFKISSKWSNRTLVRGKCETEWDAKYTAKACLDAWLQTATFKKKSWET